MSVTIDFEKDVEKFLLALSPEVYQSALRRTLKESARAATTQAVKEIGKNYNIKAKDFKKNYKLSFKNTMSVDEAHVKISTHRPNVLKYIKTSSSSFRSGRAVKKRKGTQIKVRKVGGYKNMERGFVGNKGRTVFMRLRNSKKIRKVTTLSPLQMMQQEGLDTFHKTAHETFTNKFEKNVDFYLNTHVNKKGKKLMKDLFMGRLF